MSTLCNQLGLGLTSATCPQEGGFHKRMYIGQVDDRNGSYGTLTTGEVSSFPMMTGKKLNKYVGKNFTNTGGSSVNRTDSGFVQFNQTFSTRLYYQTQTELNAIEALLKAENVTICAEQNSGKFRVFGLDYGLECTTSEEQFGQQLADGSGYINLTFTGTEKSNPKIFKSADAATLANDITYLESLLTAAI